MYACVLSCSLCRLPANNKTGSGAGEPERRQGEEGYGRQQEVVRLEQRFHVCEAKVDENTTRTRTRTRQSTFVVCVCVCVSVCVSCRSTVRAFLLSFFSCHGAFAEKCGGGRRERWTGAGVNGGSEGGQGGLSTGRGGGWVSLVVGYLDIEKYPSHALLLGASLQ